MGYTPGFSGRRLYRTRYTPRLSKKLDQRRSRGECPCLVERFTRVDVETLRYDATFVATDLWSRPWTASLLLARTGGPMFEYACHEGNVGMTNTLEIARGEESVLRPD